MQLSDTTRLLQAFAADARGATSIEYAMIGTGIAVVIAALVFNIGTKTNTILQSLASMF